VTSSRLVADWSENDCARTRTIGSRISPLITFAVVMLTTGRIVAPGTSLEE
jgi:hypothetical protein